MTRREVVVVGVAAGALVLPLLVPAVWGGLRLGAWDLVRSVIAPSEGALGVRDPVGLWAVGLAIGWFGLAYRARDWRWWELALVVVGGTAALVRTGNAWLDGLALLLPLGRQLRRLGPPVWVLAGLALLGVATAATLLLLTRPTPLPESARTAALTAGGGRVFSYWQWAPQLQHDLGAGRTVLAAGGIASESDDVWLDYLRVSQGHERWDTILTQRGVDLVVLNASEQPSVAALVRTAPDWQVVLDADGALVARHTGP